MKTSKFFITLLTLLTFSVGTMWAAAYKLQEVTSVSKDKMYVIVEGTRALTNTVSSGKLSATTTYKTTDLAGNEDYVWKLEEVDGGGFHMRNLSLATDPYLSNTETSGANLGFGNDSKPRNVWTFTFASGKATIACKANDRVIGNNGNGVYKAYLDPSSGYAMTVYELVPLPNLTISESELDFGVVKKGATVDAKSFTISGANLTNAVVNLTAPVGFAVTPATLTPDGGAIAETTVLVAPETTNVGEFHPNLSIGGADFATDSVVALKIKVGYEIQVAADPTKGTATINGGTDPVIETDANAVHLEADAKPGYEFSIWQYDDSHYAFPSPFVDTDPDSYAKVGEHGTFTAQFVERTSCTTLPAPEEDAPEVTYYSATINWKSVTGADGYEVKVSQDGTPVVAELVIAPNVSYVVSTPLAANQKYQYTVMAIGDGTTYCDDNNFVYEGEFTTADYPAATITLSENGETRLFPGNVYLMDAITLPTEALVNIAGKELVGWSETSIDTEQDSEPVGGYYAKGATYNVVNTTATLYAVYAERVEGEDVTHKLTISGKTTANTYTNRSDKDDKLATWSGRYNYPDATHIGISKSSDNNNLGSPTFDGVIKSIKATISNPGSSARTAYLRSSNTTAQPSSGDLGSVSVTANADDASFDFSFKNGVEFSQFYIYVSAVLKFHEIQVTYKAPDTYKKYVSVGTPEYPAPTFDVEEEDFVETMNVSLSSSLAGGTIYYRIDAAPVPGDAMNEGIEYTGPFPLSGDATVYAYVTKGGVASPVADKIYRRLEKLNCLDFGNQALDAKAGLDEVVVTYVDGKSAWLRDNSGSLLIYDTNEPSLTAGLQQGDVVNGLIGKKGAYLDVVKEILPTVALSALTVTHGAAPEPIEMTAPFSEANINEYVVMKGVSFATDGEFTTAASSDLTATINATDFTIRNNFKLAATFEASKTYDIVGVVSYRTISSVNQPLLFFISATDAATAIDNAKATDKAFKTIESGQLVIIKNGVRYNVLGTKIR